MWAEYAIMVVFVIALFVAEFTGHPGSTHPQLSWLLPTKSPSFHGFVDGAVLGVFMYGGWEASVYLAEEGTDVRRNPGRAGIIAVVFCTVWLVLMSLAIQAIAPASALVAHSGNIIAFSADQIWGKPWSTLVSLAVLSSVVAVTQSQLQNFSRMSFGLARDRLLPQWLGRLSRHRTPAYALTFAAIVPVVALIIYLSNASAATTIGLISGTAGLLYIVIYVAGAVACIWYYRRTLTSGARQFILAGVLPFVGGAVLVYLAIAAIPTIPHGTLYPFIVMFVLIFPAAWLIKALTKAPFFDLPPLVAGEAGSDDEMADVATADVGPDEAGHADPTVNEGPDA